MNGMCSSSSLDPNLFFFWRGRFFLSSLLPWESVYMHNEQQQQQQRENKLNESNENK
jgi:hypothetical protein